MSPAPEHLAHGETAEQRAGEHLRAQGLASVAHNYRGPHGEIDLLMEHEGTLVFVEVRYRKSEDFGGALESIDARKQAKLRATAEHFLLKNRKWAKRPCRFDVITISGHPGTGPLEWLQNVF